MSHWNQYIALIEKEVVPALGCTEPVTVALAAAKAADVLGACPEQITVQVTPNLYKNGMGVHVPGTGKAGLAIAAAAGAVAGDCKAGLEVLKDIDEGQRAQACALVDRRAIKISMKFNSDVLYTVVRAYFKDQSVEVCIAKSHSRFDYIKLNGQFLFQAESKLCTHTENAPALQLNIETIFKFASEVPIAKIQFINHAVVLNRRLAEEGLSGDYGIGLGASLQQQIHTGLLSDDLLNRAMRLGAAASDARMGGATLAAMSNSGSGNQGIAATMPIVAYAELTQLDSETYTRALIMSHLYAIYVKSKQDKLSALCAATTAAMGACAALTWLMGGDLAAINRAINSMIGDISGVFCDGAKAGCSMKVSTGASCAVKSAMLAISGRCVSEQQGIVYAKADDSIEQLGLMSRTAMCDTDKAIIDTIAHKLRA